MEADFRIDKKLQMIFTRSFICLCIVLLTGCNYSMKHRKTADDGQPPLHISGMTLMDLSGQSIDMEQFKGKTLFVNFWATWCKPCIQEMPSIQFAIEHLKNEPIEFLFVSDESPQQIERFKNNNPFTFNYVRIGNMEPLNIMGLPTTFIFNAQGDLVYNELGYKNWSSEKNINLIQGIINTQ